MFAEAVGGYEQLHDLVYAYSPGPSLIEQVRDTVALRPLRALQVRDPSAYRQDILAALKASHVYLNEGTDQFSSEDIYQLYTLLTQARARGEEIQRILGLNLVHELEAAVTCLHELKTMIRNVEQSVSGIFLVDSDVLFLPTEERMGLIQTIFRAVGNPHLANNVSGILLLAARNLLIQVIAFYCYYGRHQIYNTLKRSGARMSRRTVSGIIRKEIKRVFDACQEDNRLVLRRVMREASDEFELSIEAIQREAEASAVAAVEEMIPAPSPQAPPKRLPWWKRLFGLRS
ncbi:MAG: hypothetical protein HOI95_29390 [Chromatiales bacterium]|nr:hypothetical protein [Chromatiales bacterium]